MQKDLVVKSVSVYASPYSCMKSDLKKKGQNTKLVGRPELIAFANIQKIDILSAIMFWSD